MGWGCLLRGGALLEGGVNGGGWWWQGAVRRGVGLTVSRAISQPHPGARCRPTTANPNPRHLPNPTRPPPTEPPIPNPSLRPSHPLDQVQGIASLLLMVVVSIYIGVTFK